MQQRNARCPAAAQDGDERRRREHLRPRCGKSRQTRRIARRCPGEQIVAEHEVRAAVVEHEMETLDDDAYRYHEAFVFVIATAEDW